MEIFHRVIWRNFSAVSGSTKHSTRHFRPNLCYVALNLTRDHRRLRRRRRRVVGAVVGAKKRTSRGFKCETGRAAAILWTPPPPPPPPPPPASLAEGSKCRRCWSPSLPLWSTCPVMAICTFKGSLVSTTLTIVAGVDLKIRKTFLNHLL